MSDRRVRLELDVPSYDPRGIVLALGPDGRRAGMAATSLHLSGGFAFLEMTGVRAPFRGRPGSPGVIKLRQMHT
ncbi:hypothetical protein OG389_36480 (plasmid) [Streptomyces sp. NBC_00435]|uniref:hypothetical protein n=1 Tax=Streptomyces sp. NBC_00435 TaxID=2903649 RepID=UPI002E236541